MTSPRLRLNPADPRFADLVLADISRIRATNVGRTVFRRLLDAGCSVTIDKPIPPTSPPNAWTRLTNPDQRGGDTMIAYDPADWPEPTALGAPPSDVVLFGRLLDAIAMTSGREAAEPSETGIPAEVEVYLKERTARSPSSVGTSP